MSDDLPEWMPKTDMELIRSMVPGDLLIVRTSDDLNSSQIGDIREAVLTTVRNIEDVRVLIIPDSYLEDLSRLTLEEMFRLRRSLDHAIYTKTQTGDA